MIWHYLFYVFNSFQIPVCLMQKCLAQMDPIFRKGPFFLLLHKSLFQG